MASKYSFSTITRTDKQYGCWGVVYHCFDVDPYNVSYFRWEGRSVFIELLYLLYSRRLERKASDFLQRGFDKADREIRIREA